MKLAGVQALVLWQVLHCAVVAMWVADLPIATDPLWQLEQVPTTSLWLTVLAGVQAGGVWQAVQLVLVLM